MIIVHLLLLQLLLRTTDLRSVGNDSAVKCRDDLSTDLTDPKADARVDEARISKIIDEVKGKVSSDDYFFDDPFAAGYFDNVSTLAGYAAAVLQAKVTPEVIRKAKVLDKAFTSLFGDLSSVTGKQAAPFDVNECWLLPPELSDNAVVPITSTILDTMQAANGRYERMVKACGTTVFDDTLKTLGALMGADCENGPGENGTMQAAMQHDMVQYAKENRFSGAESENNCLHLFVARYTMSEEALKMFKKSFDKYLLALVTVQAICTPFKARCDEDAYRTQVIGTHASFAASIARTASIQLNDTAPWKCDDSQQVIIAHMNASCERVKSTATSDTDFLGETTPEEFENMTFEMAAAMTNIHAKVSRSMHAAAWRVVFPIFDMFIKMADELRRDRNRLDKNYHSDLWRTALLEYATKHGFDGCETNKCLQIFVARYTNHSHVAIEKLRHSLDKYVFISVFLKSFCNSYIEDDSWKEERRNNTIEVLRPLGDGMDLLSNISSRSGNEESCVQTTMKKPYRGASTTVPSATDSTTREVDHAWLEKANSYAKNVIDAETKSLKPKSWKERQSLHEAVANGIVKLFNDSAKNKGYRYEALAYLPYADNERHAFIKLPDSIDVVRNEYGSVNYAVARQLSDGNKVTDQWASIGKNASDILEATFSTRASNLTSRVKDVEKRFGPFLKKDGFRSLTALRCGYEFVWYQLGYRYFPAGYVTGNHTLFTEGGDEYSEKCGQIVFFP